MAFRSCVRPLALATGTILIAGVANAQSITNGSFENVTAGSIDNWVLTPFAASGESSSYTGVSPYGPRFLAFNAGGSLPGGSATQDFGVAVLGQEYRVDFAYGQFNTGTLAEAQTLVVTINNTSLPDVLRTETFTDDTPTSDLGTVWNRASFTFVGTGVPTGITFTDIGAVTTITGANSDLFVDDVSLTLIPEPSGFAMLSAGVVGLLRRRRSL